jgi:hypothetical protein
MLRRLLPAVLALSAFAVSAAPAAADPTLVGHWTFADATGGETTGNWSSFTLEGNATVSGGQLDVNGTGPGANTATGWAHAEGYIGPTIVDKTLVAQVALDDLTASGSALGLQKDGGFFFDSIVYGELQPNQWMAGSDNFSRTQVFVPGQSDTSIGNMRQVVISYQGLGGGSQRITGCLDGVLLGSYVTDNTATFAASDDTTAIWGRRHGTQGSINAHIDEAWIYDGATICTDADGDGVLDSPPNGSPTTAAQCKKDGWMSYGLFKNQGDCVSFVATGGRNAPAGS